MKRNPRLFDRVAPMGVADIAMAVSYRHVQRPPLSVPVTAFDGILDYTIAPGNIGQWAGYTSAPFRNVPVMGDHYFVASHYRQVRLAARRSTRTSCDLRMLPWLSSGKACLLLAAKCLPTFNSPSCSTGSGRLLSTVCMRVPGGQGGGRGAAGAHGAPARRPAGRGPFLGVEACFARLEPS